MTDTTHSPEENLAFLRQLATAGKDAPLMAGPYLIAGGGWYGAASLIQWPPIRDLLGLDFGQAVLAWLLAAIGFAIHLTVLIRRDRGKVENSANRTVNAAWTGVGYGIFAFWLGVAAMAYQRGDGFVMNTISLQVLSVYGIAWTIAAAATGHGWMKANAFFALLTVPVLGLFVGTGQEYLIYAIALVLTAVVPGVRLVRLAQQKQG
jgi:predicted Abi (CAAX) family protease